MGVTTRALWVLLAGLALTPQAPALAQTSQLYEQVYLSHDDAIKQALSGAERIVERVVTPTPEARKRVERRLGRRLDAASFTFYEGQRQNQPTGFAIVMDELGKYYPITFVVALRPDGTVRDVDVMVYRERRGEAVRRRRFLRQFEGKGGSDALMVNRDIIHLTGATVSSWSIAAGVKRAVIMYEEWIKP